MPKKTNYGPAGWNDRKRSKEQYDLFTKTAHDIDDLLHNNKISMSVGVSVLQYCASMCLKHEGVPLAEALAVSECNMEEVFKDGVPEPTRFSTQSNSFLQLSSLAAYCTYLITALKLDSMEQISTVVTPAITLAKEQDLEFNTAKFKAMLIKYLIRSGKGEKQYYTEALMVAAIRE